MHSVQHVCMRVYVTACYVFLCFWLSHETESCWGPDVHHCHSDRVHTATLQEAPSAPPHSLSLPLA